jgi:ABC-type nitrate/sulfonate/bicarbonate transport system substrate-binding protein
MAYCPAVLTCTDVMADEHPELVVAYMKAMIKVGRWANENKYAASGILNRQTFYRDVDDTYQGIKDVDMVPYLSPKNLVSIDIAEDFMLSHGYIHNDYDVHEWAAPQFLEQAARELLQRNGLDGPHRSSPNPPNSAPPASGSADPNGRRRT